MEPEGQANPYAPPAADLEVQPPVGDPTADLATRSDRLLGAIVDGVMYGLSSAVAYLGVSMKEVVAHKDSKNPFMLYTISGTAGVVAAVLMLSLWALQSYLIATRGQTVGKILAGTKIVRFQDGAPVGFVHGVLLRSWLVGGLALIPKIGAFWGLVDVLYIFRAPRRCVHDLIAGTKVIKLKKPAATAVAR